MNIFTRREVFVSTSLEKASQMRAKIQVRCVQRFNLVQLNA